VNASGLPFDRPLAVVEDETAFLVVASGDGDDWVVRFEKSPDFPAREWAAHMVAVFNRRWRLRESE
jgi:hypothetical protein